jgi:hypothetical protein
LHLGGHGADLAPILRIGRRDVRRQQMPQFCGIFMLTPTSAIFPSRDMEVVVARMPGFLGVPGIVACGPPLSHRERSTAMERSRSA